MQVFAAKRYNSLNFSFHKCSKCPSEASAMQVLVKCYVTPI